jgi:hypothetical protein
MRRRAALRALGAAAAGATTATAGCLSTLGLTQRGLVRAKYVTVRTENGTGRIVYDAVGEARTVARAHREDFAETGPLVVSKPLGDRLDRQYERVDYVVEHDCAPDVDGTGGCGAAELTRGDFNSLRLGDTAELFYREGQVARVVSVSRPDETPTDAGTATPTVPRTRTTTGGRE